MPLLCRNPLTLGYEMKDKLTERERNRESGWERKKGTMGRQLSVERKGKRELNKTKRGGRLGGSAG